MNTQHLLELPDDQRKYISIFRDEQERNIFFESEMISQGKKKRNKKLALAGAVLAVSPMIAGGLIAGAAASQLFKSKKPTVIYPLRNQVHGVLFPGDGIPENQTLYICNPIDTRRYYKVDDFHKEMLNHKINEAIYLLRSLGALEINVDVMEEARKEAEFNASFGMFSNDTNFASSHNSKQKFTATYTPSNKAPFIPDDVYWIDHEGQWKTIANDRIHNGLKSFQLILEVSEDFGVNSEVVAAIKGVKGNLKGEYTEFKRTSFSLSGTFSD